MAGAGRSKTVPDTGCELFKIKIATHKKAEPYRMMRWAFLYGFPQELTGA